MKHFMLDAYGVSDDKDSDLFYVWSLLDSLSKKLNFKQIAPPQLFPYYYGKIKDDEGISAFTMLEGGHITIHTFPRRSCYFVDVFSVNDFDSAVCENFFKEMLDYDKTISKTYLSTRVDDILLEDEYNKVCDFGPHLMAEIKSSAKVNLDILYDFLEGIVKDINMERISRATVFKRSAFLSGIIVIAESHIALHYDKIKNLVYADIFSCAPFDFSYVKNIFMRLGEVKRMQLIPRGTRHLQKIKKREEKRND